MVHRIPGLPNVLGIDVCFGRKLRAALQLSGTTPFYPRHNHKISQMHTILFMFFEAVVSITTSVRQF